MEEFEFLPAPPLPAPAPPSRLAPDPSESEAPGDIPASLTAYDAGTGFYSWKRRAFTAAKVRYDHPNGQTGTYNWNPAKTPNGEVLTVGAGIDCWLRPIGVSGTAGLVHEVYGITPSSSGPTYTQFFYDLSPSAPIPFFVTTTVFTLAVSAGTYLITTPINFRGVLTGGFSGTYSYLTIFRNWSLGTATGSVDTSRRYTSGQHFRIESGFTSSPTLDFGDSNTDPIVVTTAGTIIYQVTATQVGPGVLTLSHGTLTGVGTYLKLS